ncbi:hypothetical protein ACOME3_007624 [Neoechinorhynchus agilis]
MASSHHGNTVTPSGLRSSSRQSLLGSKRLDSFTNIQDLLIASRRDHRVQMVPRSLRNGSDGMCTLRSLLSRRREGALSQAPDSLVEAAANRVQFTKSRESEFKEL